MAFPISPANNVTTVVNGIIYIYNSSNNSWKVVANTIIPGIDNFARTTGNNAFNQANAVFTQSNTYVWPAANSAGAYANASFIQANAAFTAANNASDSWVRNQANASFGTANSAALYANAAFIQANAAYTAANSATDSWVRNQANIAFTAANTADGKAVTSGSYANSAFGTANSAALYANAAFLAANNSLDSWVRVQANAAYNTANSGSLYANGAFLQANAAFTAANNASDSWVRGQANAAFGTANSAALYANTAFDYANAASRLAETSFGTANSAALYANAAFLAANNAGSDSWVRNQANAAFLQANAAYTIATLGSAAIVTRTYTGNGATTNYTITTGSTVDNVLVTENGVLQTPTIDYTISGTTLAFVVAPINNVKIQIRELLIPSGSQSSNTANIAFDTANAAFIRANNSLNVQSGGTITGNLTIAGNFLPSANITYNLGSSTARWKDLYLSGNTIDLGGAQIKNDANTGSFVFVPIASANTPNPTALFISSTGSITTVQTTGGVISDANLTLAAANTANTVPADVSINVIFGQANAAFLQANAAFTAANNATDSWVRNQANIAFTQANAAFTAANNATDSWVRNQANIAFTAANTADGKAVTSGSYANSAFTKANNALPTSGGTISGSLTVTQDTTIQGNLNVLGSTTSINTSSFVVNDSLLVLGIGNYTSDALDIGFAAHYNAGTNAHTGLIRDSDTKAWTFFEGYTPEISPNNNIIITDTSFSYANVRARNITGNLIANTVTVNGVDLYNYTAAAFATANSASSAGNQLYYNSFTGDGTTTGFTLTAAPLDGSYTLVNIDGVFQLKSAYTLSGNTITFTAAPTNSSKIDVTSFANIALNTTIDTAARQTGASAFLAANTPQAIANSAALYANGAFLQANAAFTAANNASDSWVRNQANAAFIQANAAFTQSNTYVWPAANSAGSYANAAFTKANSAVTLGKSIAMAIIFGG